MSGNLIWQTFSEHLQLMLKDLHQHQLYSDMTLVSDDQTQFKAHKFAKDLEVKEISDGVEMQNEEEPNVSAIKTEANEELCEDSNINPLVVEPKIEKKKPDKKKTEILKLKKEKDQPNSKKIKTSKENKSNECLECGKVFASRVSLRTHLSSKNEKIRYPCFECEYQSGHI